jgi:hypothetical protein
MARWHRFAPSKTQIHPEMELLAEILRRLHDAKVEFSLIGGQAAVHYGVTLVTQDIGVCARFTPDNLKRIESSRSDLHPRHRFTTNRLPLESTPELCDSLRNMYLTTDLGILDCLSEVAGIGGFEEVLRRSDSREFPFGQCCVLKIDALISAREAVCRDQDFIAAKQLRAIKE